MHDDNNDNKVKQDHEKNEHGESDHCDIIQSDSVNDKLTDQAHRDI